ncbi:hypothetical protein [Actinoplanes sp. NPDC049802]|uniref:hypothetical protein n=1 Tax=Actinoplanes sp. NPDC049802 TaxID=3154742 RepID=UPI0033F961AA
MPSDLPEYDSSMIEVLEFDKAVRKRPGMYFGAGQDDPSLPTRMLAVILWRPLHTGADPHTSHVTAEITGNLIVTIADDQAETLTVNGHGALLSPERWEYQAAAALTARTSLEVWRDGRGFRQELAGARPLRPPTPFSPPPGSGTRVTFTSTPVNSGRPPPSPATSPASTCTAPAATPHQARTTSFSATSATSPSHANTGSADRHRAQRHTARLPVPRSIRMTTPRTEP